jgi:hypothetical protein
MSTGQPDDVVRLVRAPNPVQAHIWEEALRAEGIECKVVGDYLAASFGDVPGTLPELWVHRKDVERAERILHECEQAVSDEDLGNEGKKEPRA